ncbi:MAG: methyltransferase [Lachnospiraceae bacterium]|nr:methyltransferase [Lachnospiraceae bacterium]
MKQYLENIRDGREVRESLAALCGLLRSSEGKKLSAEDTEALLICARGSLSAEDPKVRKNAAKLIGLVGGDDAETTDRLVAAYDAETTLFVRSAYLEALAGRNLDAHVEHLRERLSELRASEVTEENRKHINEEVASLMKLPGVSASESSSHRFTGYGADNAILFVVNPCYREMFSDALGGMRKKVVSGGVVVRTTKLTEILPNRIWREAVFRVPEVLTVANDPYEAASVLAGEAVGAYLSARLSGEGALRYRIDFRCRDEAAKNRFVKRVAQETDRLSGGKLMNSPGDYEVTFRLSESVGDVLRLGILFAGLRDDRFTYRKETVAGSIHPTDAAYVIAAAKPFLTDDAQVLDPFCGAGTMIAERRKTGRIRSAFGVDSYGPAIDKARINVKAENVWFVHRDFFDYRQDHKFDEIITNMPFREEGGTEEIATLYRRFFRRLPEHLRESGTLVMVSHDPKLAEASVPADMVIERRIPMRERGEIAAFVIRFRGLA